MLIYFRNLLISNETKSLVIEFVPQHEDIVKIRPESIEIVEVNFTSFNYTFTIYALTPGKSEINLISSQNITR